MNEFRYNGTWNEVKGKIKSQYGDLTDDELTYEEGKEQEWYGKIQHKVGKSWDEFKEWVRSI